MECFGARTPGEVAELTEELLHSACCAPDPPWGYEEYHALSGSCRRAA